MENEIYYPGNVLAELDYAINILKMKAVQLSAAQVLQILSNYADLTEEKNKLVKELYEK